MSALAFTNPLMAPSPPIPGLALPHNGALRQPATIEPKRYTLIHFDPDHYKNAEQFCGTFRPACEKHAKENSREHVVHCDSAQSGHDINVFCGGHEKDSADIIAYTKEVMQTLTFAKLIEDNERNVASRPNAAKQLFKTEGKKNSGHPDEGHGNGAHRDESYHAEENRDDQSRNKDLRKGDVGSAPRGRARRSLF